MKLLMFLLASTACVMSLPSRADDVPPLDGHWHGMLNVKEYSAFFGKSDSISIKPYVIYIWNKAIFKESQQSSSKPYQSEIFKIVFRCKTHDATLLQDIRYAADGSVVSDDSVADTDAKYFDVNSDSKVDPHQAVVREIARIDYEITCMKGD
jgi:hypothetical protein